MLKAATILVTAGTAAALLAGCIQEAPPQQIGTGGGGTGNVGNFPSTGGTGGGGGEAGAGNAGESAAVQFFNANVFPIYHVNNLCTNCHVDGTAGAPMIMGTDATAMYAALEARGLITLPANSLLMTYGQHTGAWVQPTELSVIEEWLDMEADERGLVDENGNPTIGLTVEEALLEFAACMSLDDWLDHGMDNLPGVNTADGPCLGCHAAGLAGAYLTNNTEETFDKHRESPFWYRLVLAQNSPEGELEQLVAAERYENKGGECVGGQGIDCHPPYSLPPIVDSIGFVEATLAKLNPDGTCPEPEPGL